MTHKAIGTLTVLIVGTLALSARPVRAQVGPYYAIPSWDRRLACPTSADCPRFAVVMGGAAVLDRETGLVWEQAPTNETYDWTHAIAHCMIAAVGGRFGWRLPAVEELLTLVKPATGSLPAGNPFSLGSLFRSAAGAWTMTQSDASNAWFIEIGSEPLPEPKPHSETGVVWCVRGGSGASIKP
jgi:hypothetical protein